MGSRFRLNRYEIFALAAALVTTLLFLDSTWEGAEVYIHFKSMSAWEKAAGVFGWLIATFGPIIMSAIFWRWSKRLRWAWILHVLMIPLAYALVRSGASLILFVTDVTDFDSTLGSPMIQAGLLCFVTVIGYYSAVLHAFLKKLWDKRMAAAQQ